MDGAHAAEEGSGTKETAIETSESEVDERTEPAEPERTEPVAADRTEPAEPERTEPVEEGRTEPAVEKGTEPAAEERTEPAAAEGTEPAMEGKTEPAMEGKTEPATEGKTEPADEGRMVETGATTEDGGPGAGVEEATVRFSAADEDADAVDGERGALELRPLLPRPPPSPGRAAMVPIQEAHLLYEKLLERDLEAFRELLSAATKASIDFSQGDGFNCLQYACAHDLPEFVELLLAAGADPELPCPGAGRTALHWAAARSPAALALLLAQTKPPNVNLPDGRGAMPLQLALQNGGGHEPALALLRAGADVSVPGDLGLPLLHALPADLLEAYLDGCVVRCQRFQTDRDFSVELNFALMWPSRRGARFEMAVPYHMSTSPEHRHLLEHPVMATFLDLKFCQMQPIYVINLLLFLVLHVLLNVLVDLHFPPVPWSERDAGYHYCYVITCVFLFGIIVGKLLQMISAPTRYELSDKNDLLKLPVLFMAAVFLAMDLPEQTARQVASMLILFSWLELCLLFSRLPFCSFYAKVFLIVLRRFVGFLLLYSAIISGLAISAYMILREHEYQCAWKLDDTEARGHQSEGTCPEHRSAAVTVLHTVVMSVSKMEFKTLSLAPNEEVDELVVVAFLFIAAVVLTNLLNGLTVADMAQVRQGARIYSLVSRVRLLAYTESLALDEPCQFLGECTPASRWLEPCCLSRTRAVFGRFCCLRACLARVVRLGARLPDHKLTVFPNRTTDLTEPRLPRYWRMDEQLRETVQAAWLSKGQQPDLARRLSRLSSRVEAQPDPDLL